MELRILVVTIALSNIAAQENSKQKFTSNLIGKTFSQNPTGNLVISPFSVLANLGLAYQGASGSTYEAFTNTLTMPSSAALAELFQKIFTSLNGLENATLETANKIYVAEKFKIDPAFAGIARSSFQAEAQSVDFSGAEAEINQWVAEKTHGKITQLVSQSDFDGMTALVLLNAIYFKGDWLFKFDQTKTTKEPFFLNNSEARKVDMMHLTADLGYGEDSSLDAKILELPYKNERLSMVILLPNKKDGIDELQRKLSNFHINALLQNMDELRVQVALPKFKIETTFDLKYPLRALGLEEIFTSNANFSGMLQNKEIAKKLYVSKILQKAFIEINEEGSEAAAATYSLFQTRIIRVHRTYDFVADHPFLFFIVYRNNLDTGILFSGRVSEL